MRERFELKVHLDRDEDTGRWFVSESDIPGLWLEADDPLDLVKRVQDAAPELIELNLEEIISACRANQERAEPATDWRTVQPSLRPIFDSPLSLAHA